jgi:hypothetical protein
MPTALPFRRWSTVPMVAVAAVAALAVLRLVTQNDEYLVRYLVVDDAVYYAVPARHFVEGHGFSFDREHLTNGVQPLWAIATTALAFVLRDDLLLLRAMALLSGLLWIGAGMLLHRLLAPHGAIAALAAATCWLLTGLQYRLSVTGMENGLAGFLLACALLLAHRLAAADAARWRRRAAALGVVAALLALARIEYGLLALLFWLPVLAAVPGGGTVAARVRGSLPYWLPIALLCGAWYAFSRVYFGEWTPVSGSLKAHVAASIPDPHGGLFASMLVHLRQVAAICVLPLLLGLDGLRVAAGLGDAATLWGLGIVLALPVVALLVRLVGRLRGGAALPALTGRGFGLVFVSFALVHLALIARYLASYSNYCTWYFTAELLAICALVGWLCAAGGRAGAVLAAPLCALALCSMATQLAHHWHPERFANNTSVHVDVGRFARRWLPPGSRIGSFNSGFINLQARGQTVVNLDGLMNDGRFLREYLIPRRVDQYVREERIDYLADLGTTATLRQELANATPERPGKRFLYYRPTGLDSYSFLAALPHEQRHVPAHPLAPVLLRAHLGGEFGILQAAALSGVPADQRVVASFLLPDQPMQLHVTGNREAARTAIDGDGLARLPGVARRFGDAVELVAAELPDRLVQPGDVIAFDTYWRRLGGGAGREVEFVFVLGVPGPAQRLEWSEAPAHGTLPLAQWREGELAVHGTAVRLRPELADGPLPVAVGVRERGGEMLGGAVDGAVATFVPLGDLQIAR